MTEEERTSYTSPMAEAVAEAYRAGEEDEAMDPIVLADAGGEPVGRIADDDYVIFYDIRGEREIEITDSLTNPEFSHFPARPGQRVNFATMIEYDPKLPVRVAFPPHGAIRDTLSEVVSRAGLKQAKICETEKAVHISFFLNGKQKDAFPGEERINVHSPKDPLAAPEMKAADVAGETIRAIEEEEHDCIMVNFANVDVVGHSEDKEAILRAVEAVDAQVGRVVEEARRAGWHAVVTADHGTVEKWLYPEGTIDTGHTDSPVPFILVPPDLNDAETPVLRSGGDLQDVAPTVLNLLGLEVPPAMTGHSLLEDGGREPGDARRKARVLLLIVDGWGLADPGPGNLISQARTPVMDRLAAEFPSTRLKASGEAAGMPEGTVGNSESGHLHIGAGRPVLSDRLRIDKSLEDGSYFENEVFQWAMEGARRDKTRLHLLGIVSFYSSHGSLDHLIALLEMASRSGPPEEVYVHSLLGRRGERPEAGAKYIEHVDQEARRMGVGRVVSVIGRYWALDREYNWDRVEKTYRMLVHGEGRRVRAKQSRDPAGT